MIETTKVTEITKVTTSWQRKFLKFFKFISKKNLSTKILSLLNFNILSESRKSKL